MNEVDILKLIFKDEMQIKEEDGSKKIKINLKNSEIEELTFETSSLYSEIPPTIQINNPIILKKAEEKALEYVGTNMIYELIVYILEQSEAKEQTNNKIYINLKEEVCLDENTFLLWKNKRTKEEKKEERLTGKKYFMNLKNYECMEDE